MPFCDFLVKECVSIDSTAQSKTAVFLKVSQTLHKTHPQLSVETLFAAYWKRESLGSTTIGHGILIPHIRTDLILEPSGCFIKLKNPVDFGADDKQPIDLVVALIVPKHQHEQHLQRLHQIIEHFSHPTFRKACRNATTCDDIYDVLLTHSLETTSDPM